MQEMSEFLAIRLLEKGCGTNLGLYGMANSEYTAGGISWP